MPLHRDTLSFMGVVIREARITALGALVRLLHESDEFHHQGAPTHIRTSDEPLRAEAYVRHLLNEDNGTIMVAEEDGGVVGLVHLAFYAQRREPTTAARSYADIGDIVVTDARRRSGVGRLLMDAAGAWARERGALDIELSVWEFNEGARALYESLGYHTARRTMSKQLE